MSIRYRKCTDCRRSPVHRCYHHNRYHHHRATVLWYSESD